MRPAQKQKYMRAYAYELVGTIISGLECGGVRRSRVSFQALGYTIFIYIDRIKRYAVTLKSSDGSMTSDTLYIEERYLGVAADIEPSMWLPEPAHPMVFEHHLTGVIPSRLTC
jgi:hypothetical protein